MAIRKSKRNTSRKYNLPLEFIGYCMIIMNHLVLDKTLYGNRQFVENNIVYIIYRPL